uniref:Uncharacterized protein n=1 Tax=Ciona intestinalis TaxID=7719 RepID=H2XVD1_CIOIN
RKEVELLRVGNIFLGSHLLSSAILPPEQSDRSHLAYHGSAGQFCSSLIQRSQSCEAVSGRGPNCRGCIQVGLGICRPAS